MCNLVFISSQSLFKRNGFLHYYLLLQLIYALRVGKLTFMTERLACYLKSLIHHCLFVSCLDFIHFESQSFLSNLCMYKVWNKFNMCTWVCGCASQTLFWPSEVDSFLSWFSQSPFLQIKKRGMGKVSILPLPVFGNLRFCVCNTDRSDAELPCAVWVLNSLVLDCIYLCDVSTGGLSSVLLEVVPFFHCAWVGSQL